MAKGNKNNQKKSRTDKAVAIACIVFAVLIVGTLIFTALNESGIFLRVNNVIYNDAVEIDAAMLSFFFNNNVINWYNNYGYYTSILGFNAAADLKAQTLSATTLYYFTLLDMTTPAGITEGSTWYDYFMVSTLEEVRLYVACAKAAAAEGIELSDEELASIETDIKTLKEEFRKSGLSFSDWFGRGVNESDVRECYELMYLRDKYVEHKYDVIEDAIEAETDLASINEYIKDNKSSFYSADVLEYTIKVSSKGLTDKEYEAKVAAAKAAAENIIALGVSPEAFLEAIEAYEASVKAAETETETETGTETDTETEVSVETETEVETEAEEIDETVTESANSTEKETTEKSVEDKIEDLKQNYKYSTDTDTAEDVYDWLFEEDASEGDVKIFEETGTETEKETTTTTKKEAETEKATSSDKKEPKKYNTYEVTATYVYRANGLNNELTHNFAYLVSDDKQVIFNFIKAFNAGETKTLDSFYELAEKTYKDIHASENHEHKADEMFEFNKLEKQPAGAFGSSYAKLNEWIEDEARKDGELSDRIELTIVSSNSSTSTTTTTTKQYAVLFFEKHNVPTWQAYGQAGAVETDFEEWYEAECDKITEKSADIYSIESTIQAIVTLYSGY